MSIRQEVQQELSRNDVGEEIIRLALVALEGEDAIEKVLAGESMEASEVVLDNEGQVSPVYLQDITVSGFRGIGPETKLEIPPGPGLTVVVGHNGSGKSSFSEALEMLLTGASYRWKTKPVVWKDGWRNLHQGNNPKIVARFQVEGMNEQTVIQRIWDHSSELEESELFVQHDGQSHSNLDGIGWGKSLDLYRPILSYNELSIIEDSPSALHDTLSKVLGLEELSDIRNSLSAARLKREKYKRDIDKDLKVNILPVLQNLDDERAIKAIDALTKRIWDLNVIIDLSLEPGADHKVLQDIMNLAVPDEDQVKKVAEEINLSYTILSNRSSKEIENAERVNQLLETALRHYELHHNQPCPVCGEGILDDSWYTRALEQIKQLKDMTQGYRRAKDNLERALDKAQKLANVPNFPMSDVVSTEELSSVWNQWSLLPDNKGKVSEHLLSQYSVIRDKASEVHEQASQIFSEREKKWKAILTKLLEWVSKAQKVIKEKPEIAKIKEAEEAVKTITDNIRSRQWTPIASEALKLWKELRLQSNINLRSVELAGSRTKRKVDLKVEVDGVDDIYPDALSVASQGELSCLALSLFFPRAMLPASPFRFIMIDDPVQAMDPARVDGLARVFSKIAKERQLIVFTHDNRLPESLRLLDIDHLCLEITRSIHSVLSVKKNRDPVIRYFCDARLVIDDKKLRWAIPGFCRNGLEAACVEAVRRRRLNAGKFREEIEDELSDAKKLSQKASLVFFNDKQGGKIFDTIEGKWGTKLAEAYRDTNKGSHNKYTGSVTELSALIDSCIELADKLRYYNV